MFVVVPNDLRDKIYEKVDAQLAVWPELKPQREDIYADILAYFNEHGVIPDFTIAPKEPTRD